jgi:hypothetical protein
MLRDGEKRRAERRDAEDAEKRKSGRGERERDRKLASGRIGTILCGAEVVVGAGDI